jgi:hypothetical protein
MKVMFRATLRLT